MNPIELFHQDGKSTGIFYCEKCRHVALTREGAEQCCKNRLCNRCGKDTGSRSWMNCQDCRCIEDAERVRARFEKAEKLTVWNGPVFIPQSDTYFGSLDEFISDTDEEDLKGIEYLWACNERPVCVLHYSDIIENSTQDAYEDFDPGDLDGEEELKQALEAFNEKNKRHVVWEPDYSRAVLPAAWLTQE